MPREWSAGLVPLFLHCVPGLLGKQLSWDAEFVSILIVGAGFE